jgi:hypothetical protein
VYRSTQLLPSTEQRSTFPCVPQYAIKYVSLLLPTHVNIKNIQTYNFTCLFVWESNSVSYINGQLHHDEYSEGNLHYEKGKGKVVPVLN